MFKRNFVITAFILIAFFLGSFLGYMFSQSNQTKHSKLNTLKINTENTLVNKSEPLDPTQFRGFNLLSKVLVGDWVNGDAEEWAFKFMFDEGFNFARIPMEVQQLYIDSDYTVWNENALKEIDRILELGKKYHIHILLDLHTLPGIRPGGIEPTDDNFTSEERLTIWKDIFTVLSQRYAKEPANVLSYNLINEPYQLESSVYLAQIREIWQIIRTVDKDKLIFIDPNDWTGKPLYDLVSFNDPNLVASPHFYDPFLVTHYQAEWVEGADSYPEPAYPSLYFNGFLYGDVHPSLQQPLSLKGPFSAGTKITVRINEISDFVDFKISTNQDILFSQSFQANDDITLWKEIQFNSEWNIYQNVYDQAIELTIKKDTDQLFLSITKGDWLTISSIVIDSDNFIEPTILTTSSYEWGILPGLIAFNRDGSIDYMNTTNYAVINKNYIQEKAFAQWKEFYEQTGIPVVGCEFGVYNKTPHSISINVISDHVSLFKEHDFGFALWNLSGSFGIFNSGRRDVLYESYEGQKLDRLMLDALK